ncbi:MAG: DUF3343 domain-containing protein [Spirochaetaceae bacterium]|jgi:cytidine deaminase|nr:DUF3343 domain-containing protein [Spirochaetaceae bacterium]
MTDCEEIIVCFENVAQAIMAEQALVEKKVDVRVMPTPSSIRAGCGFCLRFLPEFFKNVIRFLAEQNFFVSEAYCREKAAGSYKKIEL